MQAIIELSKLGKYSLDPGSAEVGGTFFLIMAHKSDSSSLSELFCMAGGNGQRLQGLLGHKHPLQPAFTGKASKTSPRLKKINKLILIKYCLNISTPL